MEIQSHSKSPSVLNELGRMMGVLWGSCGVWQPQQLCRARAQPALAYRNNERRAVSQCPWGLLLLRFLSPVPLCFCWVWPLPQLLWVTFVPPWAQESIRAFPSPSSSPLPWPQWKVCSSYPMIQPITPLTSSRSGFSCLVLFFLPCLFPSVTLIPSELNYLSQSKPLILPQIWYKLFPNCFAPTPSVLGWAVFSHSWLIHCHI